MNGKTVQMWRQWWCVVRGIMWALLVFPPDSQTTLHPMAATQFSHHYIITGRSAGRLQAWEGGSLGARCPFSREVVWRNRRAGIWLLKPTTTWPLDSWIPHKVSIFSRFHHVRLKLGWDALCCFMGQWIRKNWPSLQIGAKCVPRSLGCEPFGLIWSDFI